jgi:hypothetical protein
LVACGDLVKGPPAGIATGVVISAEGPDASQVDRFSLRTDDGEVLVFRVETLDLSRGGLPAPHLREHLLSGEPITVEYRHDVGENVATRYVDAVRSSAT